MAEDLTINEAAREFGMPRSRLYAWIRSGRLHAWQWYPDFHVPRGFLWMVRRDDIRAALNRERPFYLTAPELRDALSQARRTLLNVSKAVRRSTAALPPDLQKEIKETAEYIRRVLAK